MPVIVAPVHPGQSPLLTPPLISSQPLPESESLGRHSPSQRQPEPFARHWDTGLQGDQSSSPSDPSHCLSLGQKAVDGSL